MILNTTSIKQIAIVYKKKYSFLALIDENYKKARPKNAL